MSDPETGEMKPSVLRDSRNWNAYLDHSGDGLDDENGMKLTSDFDLNVCIKGEYNGAELYHATLYIEYENPNLEGPPLAGNDVTIADIDAPATIREGDSADIRVSVKNNLSGEASGVLFLKGTVIRGNRIEVVESVEIEFTTPADSSAVVLSHGWTAPDRTGDIHWSAVVVADGDRDTSNNAATAVTKVTRLQ